MNLGQCIPKCEINKTVELLEKQLLLLAALHCRYGLEFLDFGVKSEEMGYLTLIGCLLLVFGPLVVFSILVLSKRSSLVLLAIGSSFCWLFAMSVASMIWDVVTPLRGSQAFAVAIGVLCTGFKEFFFFFFSLTSFAEGVRFLFWLIWTKGHQSLSVDAGKRLESEMLLFWESVAGGVGFAFGASLMYAGVVWDAFGPGVLLSRSCFGISVFLLGAIDGLFFNVLQIFWNVFANRAYKSKSKLLGGAVVLHHLLVSMITVFNSGEFGNSSGLCLLPLLIMIISIAFAAFVLKRSRS